MHGVMMSVASVCLYAFVPVQAAESYTPQREASPEDSKAILQVVAKFREAIKTKNSKELSTLVLNDNILFMQPTDSKPDGDKWKILSVVWSSQDS